MNLTDYSRLRKLKLTYLEKKPLAPDKEIEVLNYLLAGLNGQEIMNAAGITEDQLRDYLRAFEQTMGLRA